MKLIIDIPRKTYEHIRSWGGHGIFNIQGDDNLIVTKAIFNSTPYEERPQVNYPKVDSHKAYWDNVGQVDMRGGRE